MVWADGVHRAGGTRSKPVARREMARTVGIMTTTNPLRPLLNRAVERNTPLDPALAHLAWEYANTYNDEALLVSLAKRADIPTAVRDHLGDVPAVSVRVAYLSRSDIDPDERGEILAKEKRGTVLALLAADADCAASTLAKFATHRVLRVNLAVIANTAAPAEIRRTAVIHVDATRGTLNSTQAGIVSTYIRGDAAGHDIFARTLTKPLLLVLLVGSTTVGDVGMRRLMDRLVHPSIKTIRTLQEGPYRDRLVHQVINYVSAFTLTADLTATGGEALGSALRDVSDYLSTRAALAHQKAVDRLATRQHGSLGEDLSVALTSTNPVELAALVRSDQDVAVLSAVATNRATDPQSTAQAMNYHDTPNVVTTRRDQHDVMLALWESGYSRVVNSWTPRDEAEIALAVSMLHTKGAPNSAKSSLAQRMAGHKILPPEAVGDLPMEIFGRTYLNAALRDLAVDLVAGHLAANPIEPEVLLGMANDFESSLDDLLELSVLLHFPAEVAGEADEEAQLGTGDDAVGEGPIMGFVAAPQLPFLTA